MTSEEWRILAKIGFECYQRFGIRKSDFLKLLEKYSEQDLRYIINGYINDPRRTTRTRTPASQM